MAADGQVRERVYRELKRKLVEGELALDQHLDIRQLSRALDASPTPVKEGLVRLAGERLVVAKEKGFQVARWTAVQLQSLYAWRRDLVLLALENSSHLDVPPPDVSQSYAGRVRRVLDAVEAAAGDEHRHAADNADNRLGYARLIEATLWPDVEEELAKLCDELGGGNGRASIGRYFSRRIDAVQAIRDGAILRSHPNGN
jgi:DNA-binding GntR family transcriptional regulator